jgi:hypothetical protein
MDCFKVRNKIALHYKILQTEDLPRMQEALDSTPAVKNKKLETQTFHSK